MRTSQKLFQEKTSPIFRHHSKKCNKHKEIIVASELQFAMALIIPFLSFSID